MLLKRHFEADEQAANRLSCYMISVTPVTEIALNHRALHVAEAQSGRVVALSKQSAGILLDLDPVAVTPFDLECHVKGVSISPCGDLLAVSEDDGLSLIRLPDFVEMSRLDGLFEECRLSSDLLPQD